MHTATAFSAAMIAALAFSGCPTQSSYPATITPIYAATSTGLSVYNGSSWTNHALAGANAVVVSGSGAGAVAYVGNSAGGVSQFNGTTVTPTTGLGGATIINRLFSGSATYAATDKGVAILNGDGVSWTNNGTVSPVSDIFSIRTYTFLAAGNAGLFVCKNGIPTGPAVTPATIVLGSTSVTAVFLDSFGNLFAGTDIGLAVQIAGTSSFSANLLPGSVQVNQITMDLSGYLYAATSGGLYIVGTSWVLILPGAVSCVWVDGAGTIYAGAPAPTGLRISRNGGVTWTTELPGQQVNAVTTTAPLYSF